MPASSRARTRGVAEHVGDEVAAERRERLRRHLGADAGGIAEAHRDARERALRSRGALPPRGGAGGERRLGRGGGRARRRGEPIPAVAARPDAHFCSSGSFVSMSASRRQLGDELLRGRSPPASRRAARGSPPSPPRTTSPPATRRSSTLKTCSPGPARTGWEISPALSANAASSSALSMRAAPQPAEVAAVGRRRGPSRPRWRRAAKSSPVCEPLRGPRGLGPATFASCAFVAPSGSGQEDVADLHLLLAAELLRVRLVVVPEVLVGDLHPAAHLVLEHEERVVLALHVRAERGLVDPLLRAARARARRRRSCCAA